MDADTLIMPSLPKLGRAEQRLVNRLLSEPGKPVPSKELYRVLQDNPNAVLDQFNAHVRVVVCKLRKKLKGYDIFFSRFPERGYGITWGR